MPQIIAPFYEPRGKEKIRTPRPIPNKSDAATSTGIQRLCPRFGADRYIRILL